MKFQSRIALVLLCAAGLPDGAAADVVVPIESVSRFVNIRFAPDSASEVVGRLRQGERLPYLRSVDGWVEVALDGGGSGYISEAWVRVTGNGDFVAADTVHDEPQSGKSVAAEAVPQASAVEPATDSLEVAETAPEAASPVTAAVDQGQSTVPPENSAEPTDMPIEPESAKAGVATAEAEAATEIPNDIVTGPDKGAAARPALPEGEIGIDGAVDYLVKFTAPNEGGTSQVYDNGRNVGIGTADPQQRLEVNGNIQIHERNSNVAGLMITQASGDTGYLMHNRANTLTIGAGSVDRITITRDGNVGFGVNRPAHPLEMPSGAHVTAGGVWTNSSSFENKENVRELTPEEALAALVQLEPVKFNYKLETSEEYLGFIAEDVPDLLATADRTGLSAMDIIAVLTSVVQQQQQRIDALERRLANQEPLD